MRQTMETVQRSWLKLVYSALLLLQVVPGADKAADAAAVRFTDSSGSCIVLQERPQRVVCLVPEITRILLAIGAGDAVKGLTWHDTSSPEAAHKDIVGGFWSPCIERIDAIGPDAVFVSSLHREVREHLAGGACSLIELRSRSIEDIYRNIELLGDIFDRQEQAADLIRRMKETIELVSRKLDRVPPGKRMRVLRLMGRDRVMTPGDDSFQNEFIRAAGGIPPETGRKGEVVEVSLEEWNRLDPQLIYGCGGDRETADRLLSRPGWKDVEAVREGRIYYFPCELTCQASLHAGDFIAWLASTIYEEPFSVAAGQVLQDRRTGSKPVDLAIDYVKSARVVESTLSDFPNKTLVIEFKKPMKVLSTLEGERSNIECVGNHGSPPPCWSISHRLGFENYRTRICRVVGKPHERSSFLMTGADMDNLVVRRTGLKDQFVYALVTAGVRGNAVRMSSDEGLFHEPGTINIIVLANARLTARARARAVISATEAKTAALQDMDIRSGGNPLKWQATGTGTDEMIIVEGAGARADHTGGHCKLGELIARAVYEGVREAVFRQNGIAAPRGLLHRLQERGIGPHDLLRLCPCMENGGEETSRLALGMIEEVLLSPRYAAFLESALALSDAQERGQFINTDIFEHWARTVADEIAGEPVSEWREFIADGDIPPIVGLSLNAVLNGVSTKLKKAPGGL